MNVYFHQSDSMQPTSPPQFGVPGDSTKNKGCLQTCTLTPHEPYENNNRNEKGAKSCQMQNQSVHLLNKKNAVLPWLMDRMHSEARPRRTGRRHRTRPGCVLFARARRLLTMPSHIFSNRSINFGTMLHFHEWLANVF